MLHADQFRLTSMCAESTWHMGGQWPPRTAKLYCMQLNNAHVVLIATVISMPHSRYSNIVLHPAFIVSGMRQ